MDVHEYYELGYVVYFRDAGLNLSTKDWSVLDAVRPLTTADLTLKKAKFKHLLVPFEHGKEHPLDRYFPEFGTRAMAVDLQAILVRIANRVRDKVYDLFPEYKFVGEGWTFRAAVSEMEAMHYDSYGYAADVQHHVRVFVNLDVVPRLWGVGPSVDWAIKKFRDRLTPHLKLNANLLNAKINELIPWAEVPRHFVAFAPGNLWMVNSQVVAHEIVFGRKMFAMTFDVDPASMYDPEKAFQAVVRKAVV